MSIEEQQKRQSSPADPARVKHAPAERSHLDRSLAHGTAWTAAMKVLGQSAAWLSTLVVAKLLSPADYGIFGMASLYLGLLQILSEFGIGSAIVAQRAVTKDEAAQLNTVSVGIGVTGALIVCATAPLAALFFRAPRVVPVLMAMSVTFVIASFRTVPSALLQRDLQFKRLAVYEGAQGVVLAGASIALAASGAGYWTLVLAALLSATLSTGLTVHNRPTSFARPALARVRHTLTVGGDLIFQRLSWFVYSNADFVVAGRVLGEVALGGYTLAWTLSSIAIDKLSTMILQVTPGVFTRAREHPGEMRRYLLRITELLMLALAPVTIGMATVAPVFVRVVLGPRWIPIIPALQILSVSATVRVLMPLFGQVLLVQGLQRYATRLNFALAVLMPPVFLIGSRWGIVGLALGWVLVFPLAAATLMRATLRSVQLGTFAYLRAAVWPAVSACLVMTLGVVALGRYLPAPWSPWLVLGIQVAVGAAIYAGVLLVFHGARVRELVAMVRALRGGS